MLVIGYWDMDEEVLDDVLALYKNVDQDRSEGKLNHPKTISDNYIHCGQTSGFRLFGVEDPVQLENMRYYYHPYMKWSFEPKIKAEESIKAYLMSKK